MRPQRWYTWLGLLGLAAAAEVDWASLHCPDDDLTTLPTPTYGSEGAVFMACTELIIDASAQTIYDTLIDFKNYHVWNSFVVDVDVPPEVQETPDDVYVGMPMTFTSSGLIPLINTTSDERITVLQDDSSLGYLMNTWRFDPAFNLSFAPAEHPNILTDAGDGKTRYLSYETYYAGLGTPLVLTLKPQLQSSFDQQGLDLKAYVESL
ncbi:hypothetical protein PFICI_06110 [Pestalotiopsis fici W106-1]|uniref:Coenzyme Q-binding protein COQ10 START domain-containing protein n=1 Tax=Pestalotiopsis fici (strain W106-1 / CGMCC3.15140) TaxID=1229662 RepID=W3X4Q1_PESFW|nr:uncharacterized protein PFICI_06110 [Pestalotiopsis fici W106-1]ETS81108.1 hypothetical protein PFICI_06110 [Pestalotiopsis fici W106-1]